MKASRIRRGPLEPPSRRRRCTPPCPATARARRPCRASPTAASRPARNPPLAPPPPPAPRCAAAWRAMRRSTSTASIVQRSVRRRRGPFCTTPSTRCAATLSGRWNGPRSGSGRRRPTRDPCPWIATTTSLALVWATVTAECPRSSEVIDWATARGIGTLMWQVSVGVRTRAENSGLKRSKIISFLLCTGKNIYDWFGIKDITITFTYKGLFLY